MSSLAHRYAELLRQAAANQPLPGNRPTAASGTIQCHWQARAAPGPTPGTWQVAIAPGAVNDRVAAIPYLPTKDPRGWQLTRDYPGLRRLLQTYPTFDSITVADRLLTERDRPYLLIQSPSPQFPEDLGDFQKVADPVRPPYFRTAARWALDLYQASIFLGAQQLRLTPNTYFLLPKATGRFRLGVAPRLPSPATSGATSAASSFKELHRLYLLRDPKHPEQDRLLLQQRCFWSLWTANTGGFIDYTPLDFTGLFPDVINFLQQSVAGLAHVDLWTA